MPELCDAACQKLIINSGLMAPIADLLALTVGKAHRICDPAEKLAAACRANYAASMVAIDHGIIARSETNEKWAGCPEATQLMAWINVYCDLGMSREQTTAAISTMTKWTDVANKRTAALVSGN